MLTGWCYRDESMRNTFMFYVLGVFHIFQWKEISQALEKPISQFFVFQSVLFFGLLGNV